MKTKVVTSYYGFHDGEPFWGQLNRDRWYKYSLATVCGMGCEVVCYTDAGDKGYNQLVEIKEKFNLNNLTIKVYEMINNPYQEQVHRIRMSEPETYNNPDNRKYYTRSTQIYWMKYSFLEMEYEPGIQLYWIDSGLSHSGLFPKHSSKYSTEEGYNTFYGNEYMSNEYKIYHFDKAFSPEVLERINNFAENKIINLYRNTSDDDHRSFNEKLGVNLNYENVFPVAGIFGGESELFLEYIIKSKEVVNQILQTNNICSEQEIMAYLNATNRQWFKNWKFDTFYHEDWENIFTPDMISFSHFFLKNLN